MSTVAASTTYLRPLTFGYVETSLATAAWVFPTNRAQTAYAFPGSNTRSVLIYNTGANALLVGLQGFTSEAGLPSQTATGLAFQFAFSNVTYPTAAGLGITVTEGDNCSRVPVGGSLVLDIGSFQERGNMSPVDGSSLTPTGYPLYLLFFSSIGGNTTADITYTNKFGTF